MITIIGIGSLAKMINCKAPMLHENYEVPTPAHAIRRLKEKPISPYLKLTDQLLF